MLLAEIVLYLSKYNVIMPKCLNNVELPKLFVLYIPIHAKPYCDFLYYPKNYDAYLTDMLK